MFSKTKSSDINVISYYIAVATILQIIDSMIPYPMFGIKLGLANIVPLFVLNIFGFSTALKISFFRPIVSAILVGSLGGSIFVISFLSSVFSLVLMYIVRFLFGKILSNIGVSIIGAVGHNLLQLVIVYLLFVNNKNIFFLLPILVISGVIVGFITGYLVNSLLNNFFEEINGKNFLEGNILSQLLLYKNEEVVGEKSFFYYIFISVIVISIILTFSLIKDFWVMFILFFLLLLKKFFTKANVQDNEVLLKKFLKIKIFVYILLGIIFTNLVSNILYGYSKEQIIVLLKNLFFTLLKFITFILLTQDLFCSKYGYRLIRNFPFIFKSIIFVNIILPKIDIKKNFNVLNFLEKILVKDVFLS